MRSRATRLLGVLLGGGVFAGSVPAGAQETEPPGADWELEARVWFDRGVEPVVTRGDRIRVYYRTTRAAHVAVVHIDTAGRLQLLHPHAPDAVLPARGRADYRLLFPYGSHWVVDEHPGVGYFFVIASEIPFDFAALAFSTADGGWDLTPVVHTAYHDPFVAIDELVEVILPEWEHVEYAIDFAQYHVDRTYSYPRFLCYDCHVPRPYAAWNPYHYTCTSVRIVIFNDPYFYPATRYRGNRVVYTRPPEMRRPQFTFKERAPGEPGTPVVQTRGAAADAASTPPRRAMPRDAERRPAAASGAPPGGAPDRLPRALRDNEESNPPVVRGAEAAPAPERERRALPRRDGAVEEAGPASPAERRRPVLERRVPLPPPPSAGASIRRGDDRGSPGARLRPRGGDGRSPLLRAPGERRLPSSTRPLAPRRSRSPPPATRSPPPDAARPGATRRPPPRPPGGSAGQAPPGRGEPPPSRPSGSRRPGGG